MCGFIVDSCCAKLSGALEQEELLGQSLHDPERDIRLAEREPLVLQAINEELSRTRNMEAINPFTLKA